MDECRMNRFELKNGITVYLDPLENTHSICLSLCTWAGPLFEKKQQNGISHFLEHLHFRALGNWTQRRLYFEMEKIGTTLRGTTYNNYLKFEVKVLPQYLLQALNLLKKVLETKEWKAEDFEAEKAVVLNELNEKYDAAGELALQQIFKECSYGGSILGTEKTVSELSLKDVLSFKQRIFSASNISLFVSGAFQTEKLLNLLNQKLGEYSLSAPVNLLENPICLKAKKIKMLPLAGEFTEAAVSFAIPRRFAEKNQAALDLLQCILGEGVGSLLQRRIREELRLTNCIYTQLDYFGGFAILQINFSVLTERFLPCLQAVFAIMNGLKKEVDAGDLAAAVPFYAQNRLFELDDPVEKNAQNILFYFVRGMERPSVSSYCNITAEIIRQLASNLFQPENAYLTVCSSRKISVKSLKKQLELLNE